MAYPQRTEVLTWADVDRIIDALLPQIKAFGPFDAMLLITRGGVIPGGMLAEALDIQHLLTAAVNFPAVDYGSSRLLAMPSFLQFPDASLLINRKTLVVDDVWGSGRTATSVRERVMASDGEPYTCVLHYNPYRSVFTKAKPDFYGDVTDAYIVYPWEIDRGPRGIGFGDPMGEPEPGIN